ncbi:hypothetical protein [Acidovorax sp. NCPPB 4044]|uniref:hypothetical protein n=1 Tax=Acidovorax sp. NCPPB 4044 TaxID=2940490 RepID=UPI0023036564|nr:hypothetical protein [Acidovorax sp. NCPPB 4044]MDA8523695.1 hypothetical protein [Acidovorax sp. NCPPB 4044]
MTNAIAHAPAPGGHAAPTAQALFDGERLPFPPLPAPLAASLRPWGPAWFATRPVDASPYGLGAFLAEAEARPDLPEYALVGFDGHGTNSWAVHFYRVAPGIALFIQLPWGGAYTEPEPARAEIADVFAWAGELQARVQQAVDARKIPEGMRIEIAASRFGRAGWRWLGAHQDAAAVPWNPPGGMKAATLRAIDDAIAGRPVLPAA